MKSSPDIHFRRWFSAAPVQPLPTSHLIFRVSSQGAGKCWMDALELALKCSSLLIRSMSTRSSAPGHGVMDSPGGGSSSGGGGGVGGGGGGSGSSATSYGGAVVPNLGTSELHWNESDFEKHFKDHGIYTFLSIGIVLLFFCIRIILLAGQIFFLFSTLKHKNEIELTLIRKTVVRIWNAQDSSSDTFEGLRRLRCSRRSRCLTIAKMFVTSR